MSDTNTQNTQNAGNAGPVAAAPAQGKQLPEACEHTTRHSITVNGGELDYAATVGTILIDTPKVPKAASIFFTAFDLVNGEGKTLADKDGKIVEVVGVDANRLLNVKSVTVVE